MARDFITQNASLAGFLSVRGHTYRVERVDSHRALFRFFHTPALDRDQRAFFLNESAPAKEFAEAIRRAKAIARDTVGYPNNRSTHISHVKSRTL